MFFALATFLTSRLPRVVVIKDSSETTCQTLFKGGRLLYQRTVLKILLGTLLLEIFFRYTLGLIYHFSFCD